MLLFAALAYIISGCDDAILDDGGDESPAVFTVFTSENGLADNTVTDIAIDHLRGGVWCATLNGVSFYSLNDSVFTTFGADYDIPNMETTSLAFDYLTGNILLGTVSGNAYLDNTWHSGPGIESLVHRYVTAVAAKGDGAIWYGTRGGSSRYEALGGWTSFTAASGLPSDTVTSIAFGPSGDTWMATANGIGVFDGTSWRVFGTDVLSHPYVNAVYRAHDGSMWCGTASGINLFDGAKWHTYGTFDGLPSPGVNDFVMDAERTMWAATDSGAARLTSGKWARLKLPDTVDSERVLALAFDVINGDLWIGTTRGLVRYSPAAAVK